MSATETHVHIERADRIKIFANSLYQPLQCTGGTFHAEPNSRNIDGKLMLSAALLADFEAGTFSTRDFVLLKKPLSAITDKDAIAVSILEWELGWKPTAGNVHHINTRIIFDCDDERRVEFNDDWNMCQKHQRWDSWPFKIQSIDFLRSKGYALPFGPYSVNQLVVAGIYKLI